MASRLTAPDVVYAQAWFGSYQGWTSLRVIGMDEVKVMKDAERYLGIFAKIRVVKLRGNGTEQVLREWDSETKRIL